MSMTSDLITALRAAVSAIRQRVQSHRDQIRSHETQTRYSLIDPIISALGWNVEDPSSVRTELPVRIGKSPIKRVDYALIGRNGQPCVYIESKAFGTLGVIKSGTMPFTEHDLQLLMYAESNNIRLAALTDGNRWTLYDLKLTGSPSERVRFDIELLQPTADRVVEHLLELSHSRLAIPFPNGATTSHYPLHSPTGAAVPSETKLLSEIRADYSKPIHVLFSDGTQTAPGEISVWSDVVIAILSWLAAKGVLNRVRLPLTGRGGAIMVLSAAQKQILREPRIFTERGLAFEGNHDAPGHMRTCIQLLDACGQDPARFRVHVRRK